MLRRMLFLILPILIHFTPPLHALPFRIPFLPQPGPPQPSPEDVAAALAQTHGTLLHLLPALHLLKYAGSAAMRVPALRARAAAWWEEEERVGGWIRADGVESGGGEVSVRSVAKGLDLSFEEGGEGREDGKLLVSARMAARALLDDGLRPSEHWRPGGASG